MVALTVSRSGRELQRYNDGQRLVVGCIPYRIQSSLAEGDALQVLVISCQRKGKGMMFPKGGWEEDESIKEAALRETVEEAGVSGVVEELLGMWNFKSKAKDDGGSGCSREGYMFPMRVVEELDTWPEKDIRQRVWVSVGRAKQVCQQSWMLEALDRLVDRLKSSSAPPKPLVDHRNPSSAVVINERLRFKTDEKDSRINDWDSLNLRRLMERSSSVSSPPSVDRTVLINQLVAVGCV